jgi:hypothetical protein
MLACLLNIALILDNAYLGRSEVKVRIVLVNHGTVFLDGGQANVVRGGEHFVENKDGGGDPDVVVKFHLGIRTARSGVGVGAGAGIVRVRVVVLGCSGCCLLFHPLIISGSGRGNALLTSSCLAASAVAILVRCHCVSVRKLNSEEAKIRMDILRIKSIRCENTT